MTLEIVEKMSVAGAAVNEDRVGAAGALAWVIDGATDAVATPLAGERSDADWIAGEIDAALRGQAAGLAAPLAGLPASLAAEIAQRFERAARRPPAGRAEHPSAAGLIVRAAGQGLDYVSLGDCALIAADGQRTCYVGIGEDRAGDRWVAEAIASYLASNTGASLAAARANLRGAFAAARAVMNTPGGYGIFSITPPPAELVGSGSLDLAPGAHVLLATDGLMRLVDVFRRYDARALVEAARARGLAALARELRDLEQADVSCALFPRAKVSDDASAVLLRVP